MATGLEHRDAQPEGNTEAGTEALPRRLLGTSQSPNSLVVKRDIAIGGCEYQVLMFS